MKLLENIALVQFFLYEAKDLETGINTAFLGPNGTGKSALLDAIQVVMLAADGNRTHFNAASEGKKRSRKRSLATLNEARECGLFIFQVEYCPCTKMIKKTHFKTNWWLDHDSRKPVIRLDFNELESLLKDIFISNGASEFSAAVLAANCVGVSKTAR